MGLRTLIILIIFSLIYTSCKVNSKELQSEFDQFVLHYDSVVNPLNKEIALTEWKASISGKDEDFNKLTELQTRFAMYHSNHDAFKKLEEIKSSEAIKDNVKERLLEVLYLTYLSNQADTSLQQEIISMENNIEKKFNNFRAEVNGKQLTDNEVEDKLINSTDNNELQAVWEAHKKIGPVVAADIIALVKKRNQLAEQLGFANFHEMSLRLSDQDPGDIEQLFNELDELTRASFATVKNDVDSFLSHRLGIEKNQMMPWDYQNRYFQEAPKIYAVDLDKYFKDKNLEKITSKYYAGIDLPIEDMLAKSDLYEKPGKNQHAFCIDIDNNGDVRVLCNIKPTAQWMNTMLHEYGHAVYDKYINRQLPFTLRQPAHIFTTEAIAMLFGRMYSNPQWLLDMQLINKKEAEKISASCFKSLKLEQLVFSRWSQVMYRFEKSMYDNPDQDLNALWWQLVEKYQMIKKPENRNQPDWATKIHIASSPCYYHNYLLGELLASQINYHICTAILNDSTNINTTSYNGKKEIGEYLKTQIFEPGMLNYWNDMIEKATGEKLTAKYYAKQFVE
jgi:peptidyl-dipeptidase A